MNIPQLITQLNSTDIRDQNQAAYQFGMLGNIAAMAIPALLVAYKNRHLRYNVQWALSKISAPPIAIASELFSALKDEDTAIQEYAAWALGTRRLFTAIKPEHLPLLLQTFRSCRCQGNSRNCVHNAPLEKPIAFTDGSIVQI